MQKRLEMQNKKSDVALSIKLKLLLSCFYQKHIVIIPKKAFNLVSTISIFWVS